MKRKFLIVIGANEKGLPRLVLMAGDKSATFVPISWLEDNEAKILVAHENHVLIEIEKE